MGDGALGDTGGCNNGDGHLGDTLACGGCRLSGGGGCCAVAAAALGGMGDFTDPALCLPIRCLSTCSCCCC